MAEELRELARFIGSGHSPAPTFLAVKLRQTLSASNLLQEGVKLKPAFASALAGFYNRLMNKATFQDNKTRLDKACIILWPEYSRASFQKLIEQGHVKVNGHKVTEAKHVIRKGDQITWAPPKIAQLGEADIPDLKILYNNHGLLILDKPAGLTVHPGSGVKEGTLADALLNQFKDIKAVGESHRSGIVHRLDKETSGVMLVALTPQIYEYLKDAFAERRVKKEYLALILGVPKKSQALIDLPIGKSRTDFRKHTTKNPQAPKPASTEYKVLEVLTSGVDKVSLISVKLHTGRTHQIRVHMASLGHPVVGDKLYGPKVQPLEIDRQFLHARRIEVQLPDATWIEAEAELPKELRTILKDLKSKLVGSL